jgi:hypothetical protein
VTLAALTQLVPVALDGESVTGNGTAIAAISLVSIVGGYLLLAALWHFVFRDRARGRRGDKRKDPLD